MRKMKFLLTFVWWKSWKSEEIASLTCTCSLNEKNVLLKFSKFQRCEAVVKMQIMKKFRGCPIWPIFNGQSSSDIKTIAINFLFFERKLFFFQIKKIRIFCTAKTKSTAKLKNLSCVHGVKPRGPGGFMEA